MLEAKYGETFAILRKAVRPVLVSHPNPDGDTLGSALGMWHALKVVGVQARLFCVSEVPRQYWFMKGADAYMSSFRMFEDADVVCTFDAGDLIFAGIQEGLQGFRGVLLNIDHHYTNKRFGQVNVVNVEASSTAEVVYSMVRCERVGLTRDMATCLLTGILTDTSGLSNPGTTTGAFAAVAELVRAGAKVQEVHSRLVRNISVPAMRVWGHALSRLKYDVGLRLAGTAIFEDDLTELGLDSESVAGVSNFLSRNLIAESIMVLREEGEMVRGSLRTVLGGDVSAVAAQLGGGGHRKAAGFAVEGELVERETYWGVERVRVQ